MASYLISLPCESLYDSPFPSEPCPESNEAHNCFITLEVLAIRISTVPLTRIRHYKQFPFVPGQTNHESTKLFDFQKRVNHELGQ